MLNENNCSCFKPISFPHWLPKKLSDPNSDLFDNEEYNIQKEIEQLSLGVSKKAAERDHELRELYLQQGSIPKKNVQNAVHQAGAPPVKEPNAPSFKESSAPPLKKLIGKTKDK